MKKREIFTSSCILPYREWKFPSMLHGVLCRSPYVRMIAALERAIVGGKDYYISKSPARRPDRLNNPCH